MIFYNKDVFTEGRTRPREAAAGRPTTKFLATAQKIMSSGAAPFAIYPAPTQRVLPVLVRLLPLLAAADRRQELDRGRQGAVHQPDGLDVGRTSGRASTATGPRRQGEVPGRRIRRRQGRHGDRRAVGHRGLRRQGPVGRRCPSRPRTASRRRDLHLPATRRTSACTPRARTRARRGTCLKFATSKEQDGKLLTSPARCRIRDRRRHHLRRLLRFAPRVQGVRRPERPHRGRPDRDQHDRRRCRPCVTPTRRRS